MMVKLRGLSLLRLKRLKCMIRGQESDMFHIKKGKRSREPLIALTSIFVFTPTQAQTPNSTAVVADG